MVKNYKRMSDQEVNDTVKEIIQSSSTDEEIRQRIKDELGYPYDVVLSLRRP